MRIIAGTARGRSLFAPKSREIRPTSDRTRESLFNVLGQYFDGLEVLDLYAGTGALGLEAISRGAARATLVDVSAEARALCRRNAEALGFADRVEIVAASAVRAIEQLGRSQARFDLIFADPPYADRAGADLLAQLEAAELLREEGTFCLEHDRREAVAPAPGSGWQPVDQRAFGDTAMTLFRRG